MKVLMALGCSFLHLRGKEFHAMEWSGKEVHVILHVYIYQAQKHI